VSHAQQAGKIYRVGVLLNRRSPGPETETLRSGLTQLGYVEGTNVVYEVRAAEGQLDRLPGFAAELVSKGVDVIVSYGGPPTNAARNHDDPDRVYPCRRSGRHWRRGYA
jgi:putative ABC transport system substrate-binding protein